MKPVSLDSVFVSTSVAQNYWQSFRNRSIPEDLQEYYYQRSYDDYSGTCHGIGVANQEQYLAILGEPGFGKSTFLRKVELEAIRQLATSRSQRSKSEGDRPSLSSFEHRCIPVFIELKEFNGETVCLEKKSLRNLRLAARPIRER